MSKSNGKKGLLVFIGILIIAVVVFLGMLFSGASYTASKVGLSSGVIDKLQTAILQTGTVDLNSDELNQIINMNFEAKKYSSLTVKGIKSEIEGSNVSFNIPVNYKGINLLVRVKGNLTYDSGINYKVLKVYAGKIPVSKKLLLEKIDNKLGSKAAVKDDTIHINSVSIPVTIKSIDVRDSKMTVSVEKLTDQIKNKLQSMER